MLTSRLSLKYVLAACGTLEGRSKADVYMYGVLVWVGFFFFFLNIFLSVFTTLFYHGLQVCSVVQTIVFSTSGGLLVSVK